MNNLTEKQHLPYAEGNVSNKSASISGHFILPLYFTVGYWILAALHNLFIYQKVPVIGLGNMLFFQSHEYLYSHIFYGIVLFCTASLSCSTLNRGRAYNFNATMILPATGLLLLFYLCNIGYSMIHFELLIGSASYLSWNSPLFIYTAANYCMLTTLKMMIFITLFAGLFRMYRRRFNSRIKGEQPVMQAGYVARTHALLFALGMNIWVLLVVELMYQPLLYSAAVTPHSALSSAVVLTLFLAGNLLSVMLTWSFTRSQFPADAGHISGKRVVLAAMTCIGLQMLLCLILALAFLLMIPESWSLYEAPHISNIGLPEVISYSYVGT
ncbi:MAG: hypothetical protein ACRC5A_09975 [Enterobacteriaceae bacterium]